MMFKLLPLLTISIIISFAQIVHANDNNDKFCTSLGEIAGRAMGARISGIPAENLLTTKFNPAIRDIALGLIKEAYSRPLSSLEDERIKNMSDFRNEVELHCHNSLKN